MGPQGEIPDEGAHGASATLNGARVLYDGMRRWARGVGLVCRGFAGPGQRGWGWAARAAGGWSTRTADPGGGVPRDGGRAGWGRANSTSKGAQATNRPQTPAWRPQAGKVLRSQEKDLITAGL